MPLVRTIFLILSAMLAVVDARTLDGDKPAEYTLQAATYAVRSTATWGLDVSASPTATGGVGGLLAVNLLSSVYFPTHDGNGNVVEYLDASGNVAVHREYDPFGNVTVDTAPALADSLPIGFSSKFRDPATGLIDYGLRWFDPLAGRWLSRDPIGEQGGINLYQGINNDFVNRIDYLGMRDFDPTEGADVASLSIAGKIVAVKSKEAVIGGGSLIIDGAANLVLGFAGAFGGGNALMEYGSPLDRHFNTKDNVYSFFGTTRPPPMSNEQAWYVANLMSVTAQDLWLAIPSGGGVRPNVPGLYPETPGWSSPLPSNTLRPNGWPCPPLYVVPEVPRMDRLVDYRPAKTVATPHGPAVQAMTAEAQVALRQAQSGATVFRQGEFGVQKTFDAQFWAFSNPVTTPGFAGQLGMPGSAAPKVDWIMGGTVRPGSPVITRPAPGIGGNDGGSMEAVVPPGGVKIDWFHMPD